MDKAARPGPKAGSANRISIATAVQATYENAAQITGTAAGPSDAIVPVVAVAESMYDDANTQPSPRSAPYVQMNPAANPLYGNLALPPTARPSSDKSAPAPPRPTRRAPAIPSATRAAEPPRAATDSDVHPTLVLADGRGAGRGYSNVRKGGDSGARVTSPVPSAAAFPDFAPASPSSHTKLPKSSSTPAAPRDEARRVAFSPTMDEQPFCASEPSNAVQARCSGELARIHDLISIQSGTKSPTPMQHEGATTLMRGATLRKDESDFHVFRPAFSELIHAMYVQRVWHMR